MLSVFLKDMQAFVICLCNSWHNSFHGTWLSIKEQRFDIIKRDLVLGVSIFVFAAVVGAFSA